MAQIVGLVKIIIIKNQLKRGTAEKCNGDRLKDEKLDRDLDKKDLGSEQIQNHLKTNSAINVLLKIQDRKKIAEWRIINR